MRRLLVALPFDFPLLRSGARDARPAAERERYPY